MICIHSFLSQTRGLKNAKSSIIFFVPKFSFNGKCMVANTFKNYRFFNALQDLMPFGNYETKFISILTENSGPRQLDFLLVLVANQWQLWNSLVEPNPCGYLDEISSLEKLIRSPRNILGMAGQFKASFASLKCPLPS